MRPGLVFAILASFFLISCDPPNYVFEDSRSFIGQPWVYPDSVVYRFKIKDTTRYYNLLLELDHGRNYPFENLYVRFETTFPDATVKSDVVSISLADETGAWYSDCRGRTCTFYLTLQDQVIFARPGDYEIRVRPWMRIDTIEDVYRLAFRVERGDKRPKSGK